MKLLILVVHASLQHELADTMRAIDEVKGFTFTPVQGHGRRAENDPFLSTRDRVVGYVPRIKVEIMLPDEDVDGVLARLRQAMCHERSRGAYWVVPVLDSGEL